MPRGVIDVTLKPRMLEQARGILLRDGADALTVRTLAREVGVSVGVLYNHFPDMRSVLVEVAADALSQSAARVADAMRRCASRPVETLLVEVGAVMLDGEAVRVAQAVFARPSVAERLGEHLAGMGRPGLGEVEDLVQAELVRRDLDLEPRNARTAARMFIGLIHEILRSGPREDSASEVDTAARLLAAGLTDRSVSRHHTASDQSDSEPERDPHPTETAPEK